MAFDTFMQIDSVQGESTDEKHINWIGIYSYSHGLSQTGSGSVSIINSLDESIEGIVSIVNLFYDAATRTVALFNSR